MQVPSFILCAIATVTCASRISEQLRLPSPDAWFDVTGCVTFVSHEGNGILCLNDASGSAVVFLPAAPAARQISRGHLLHARGHVRPAADSHVPTAFCTEWDVLGRTSPPKPASVSEQLLQEGVLDSQVVTLSGTVADAFRDEIDPKWNYLILDCGGEMIMAVSPSATFPHERLNRTVDAEVQITGLCLSHALGARQQTGTTIYLTGERDLQILRPAPADPFAVPEIPDGALSPSQIRKLGKRRIQGRILAVWNGNRALLRTASGRLTGLAFRNRPPSCGSAVEAVGNADTDLYRINLSRVDWRPVDGSPAAAREPAEPVSAAAILRDSDGNSDVSTRYHGRAIRLDGEVVGMPSSDNPAQVARIANDGLTVPVDFTSAAGRLSELEIGCRVRIAGICVLNTENWHPHAGFPHTDGFTLVLRSPDDLVVLSRPPWWTAGRLLAVIGVLLSALVGIAIWNRALNRLAERRGRELARERSAHERAELKLEERMRLAVELHDTVAQDLTGIALKAEAAGLDDRTDLAGVLADTSRALAGCRERLRDCIWDLRNRALEEPTLEGAVRRTLSPHLDRAELVVDSTVAKRRFSDNALHQTLNVLRELAINAIRHGGASRITVICRAVEGRLDFTVVDDGRGFDVGRCPQSSDGHFGLQGIRERVHRLEGDVRFESSIGKGTTVRITGVNPEI